MIEISTEIYAENRIHSITVKKNVTKKGMAKNDLYTRQLGC